MSKTKKNVVSIEIDFSLPSIIIIGDVNKTITGTEAGNTLEAAIKLSNDTQISVNDAIVKLLSI